MLIRCRFDFKLTDIKFALIKTSLKQLLVSSYGKELYKETSSLQQQKIKKAIAKNGLIFYKDVYTITSHRNRVELKAQ